MEITKEQAQQIKDALMALGVFDTPLMRRRLGNEHAWDEYCSDATTRRMEALDTITNILEK